MPGLSTELLVRSLAQRMVLGETLKSCAIPERESPLWTTYVLMVEFFGFSISAIVPDGPSSGKSAELSTMVMSPPPRAGDGSIFIAGFSSDMVWTLPDAAGTVSASAVLLLIEAKMALSTDARATAGTSVPMTISNEMRETAACTNRFDRYFVPREPPRFP